MGVRSETTQTDVDPGARASIGRAAGEIPAQIAALFVETDGCYFGLMGVDPWDKERDARKYAGPHSVVAHPPCERWSLMGLCRGYYDGQDDGCFESALRAVRRFGGVLEHPAHSLAWKRFGLPYPSRVAWTQSALDPGWSCEVDQRQYGHEARKPTWLYYVGTQLPPMLIIGHGSPGEKTVGRSWGQGRQHLRSRTPIAFRDLLLSIARNARRDLDAAEFAKRYDAFQAHNWNSSL